MQTNLPFVFDKALGPTNIFCSFVLEVQGPDLKAYDLDEFVFEFRLGRTRAGGDPLIVTRSDQYLSSGRPQIELDVAEPGDGTSLNRITVWCDPAVPAWTGLQHRGRYQADLNLIGPFETTPFATGRVTIMRESNA